MPKKYDWKPLRHPVVDQKEPTLEDLNDFITKYPTVTNKSPRWQVAPYEAAKLKRDAILHKKDALTLTMSVSSCFIRAILTGRTVSPLKK